MGWGLFVWTTGIEEGRTEWNYVMVGWFGFLSDTLVCTLYLHLKSTLYSGQLSLVTGQLAVLI